MAVSPDDLGFDPEAIRARYAEERARRQHKTKKSPYVYLTGEFEEYATDPYVEPGFTREPINDEIDVLVLGGGFTGLMTGARLRQAGIDNFRIIDNAGDFGGTWYWNRYPGIRCDVESYAYMPLLEETGYMPTEKYVRGGEIFAYCQMVGRQFNLYEKAIFQTKLDEIQWDEATSRWIVKTDRGDQLRARFVCAGAGVLSKARLPVIEGINSFKGHSFHTSRWDFAYTGGDETGNLTGLRDKRVAIIGTGATAIQAIPYLGADAKHLYVFQRTPSSVDVRDNKPTDPEWFKSLKPGWHQDRMDGFQKLILGLPDAKDDIGDRWADVQRMVQSWSNANTTLEERGALAQLADFAKMEQIRKRIGDIVEDPETAEALKPWYNLWCKRPLFSDEYLQTFNRPNVTLVHMNGRPIDRVSETGIEFDGQHYEVDCIIYASGFDLAAPTYEAGAYEIIGKNGTHLREKWVDGVRSLHGTYMEGFPNLFVIGGIAQASISLNFPHMLGGQASHVADVIRQLLADGVKRFEVKPEAEEQWAEKLALKRMDNTAFEKECTPGEYNNEGNPEARPSHTSTVYGGGAFEFFDICKAWRTEGIKKDLDLQYE